MRLRPIDFVKTYYSDPDIIRQYATVGLWPSEEMIVDRYFEPGSTVLDIGCGAGRTSIALTMKGYKVTAIDLIPEMIDAAKEQAKRYSVKINFQVMDASQMTFPLESFDHAFFSFNGFEQIPGSKNREKVLSEVWRVLKVGGIFVLTTRSGLAAGKRWLGWPWLCLEFLYRKMLDNTEQDWELGDKVRQGNYHHYLSPFMLRKLLSCSGFNVFQFNSSKNIEKGRRAQFFTNFSKDKALFYVAKKNLATGHSS